MDNAEERVGCFSASNISRLLAGGGGSTRKSYILELAIEVVVGSKPQLDTGATKHGIANQINAFEFVLKPLYKGVKWVDKYIPINSNCGASPDCVWNENYPIDIKCPYEIDTYLEQIEKIKPSYYLQLQMQMMAVKGDRAALCTYLTKKEEWGSDTWEEYPFPLQDRYKVEEIVKDDEAWDRIEKAVENSAPERDDYIQILNNAKVMDEVDFFYTQMKHNKYRNIKSASNILNLSEVIRVKDQFYYKMLR